MAEVQPPFGQREPLRSAPFALTNGNEAQRRPGTVGIPVATAAQSDAATCSVSKTDLGDQGPIRGPPASQRDVRVVPRFWVCGKRRSRAALHPARPRGCGRLFHSRPRRRAVEGQGFWSRCLRGLSRHRTVSTQARAPRAACLRGHQSCDGPVGFLARDARRVADQSPPPLADCPQEHVPFLACQ